MAAFHLRSFAVVNGEAVSESIASYGIYEPALTQAFIHLVQPDWQVLDVGMHLGYYATLFANLVGPRGVVHGFEPTPSTRTLAAENTRHFNNIIIHPQAAWSSTQKITFHDYGPQWMAFNSFTAPRMNSGPPPPIQFVADAITLDSFRSQLNKPIALIKIDAESAELEILKGAKNLLRSDRPLISLEVGDVEETTASPSTRLIEFMLDAGYASWEFSNGHFVPHHARAHYEYDNLVFAPTDLDLTKK